jgi:hypothetical protein
MDLDEILSGDALAFGRLGRPKVDLVPGAPECWPPLP